MADTLIYYEPVRCFVCEIGYFLVGDVDRINPQKGGLYCQN